MASLDTRILCALRSTREHRPRMELADELGIDPQLLEQRLQALRAADYKIDEQPHLGCRLVAAPDRLIADDLHALAGNLALAREIIVFEKTGSTNDVVTQLGRAGSREGLVVFAEQQSSGRGRLGRCWVSAARQGLWFSLLLRPSFPVRDWGRLTTWAAVAIAEAVEQTLGERAFIKWPNDIFLRGRKAGGILIESIIDQKAEPFAIIGVGLNVNQAPGDFPRELLDRATSLRECAGRRIDRQELAAAVLQRLDALYARLPDSFAAILEQAAQRSSLLGSWIRACGGSKTHEGIAERLDSAGGLILREADGNCITLSSGEVSVSGVKAFPEVPGN